MTKTNSLISKYECTGYCFGDAAKTFHTKYTRAIIHRIEYNFNGPMYKCAIEDKATVQHIPIFKLKNYQLLFTEAARTASG